MPSITINIDEDAKTVLDKRAKKNFLTLRELVEDIVRRSAIRTSKNIPEDKTDDELISIFSRRRRGNAKK